MNDDFYCDLELGKNIDLLADCISNEIGSKVISFDKFLDKQNKYHEPPRRPNKPISRTNDPREHQLFEHRYNQALRVYNQLHLQYEQSIQEQKFFQQYESTKQGYIDYLTENSQVITPFLNRVNKFPISETNRQFHTYISGNTGSGKSETIKSFIWHYLTRNTNTALVLLDPHGQLAKQVAKFNVNLENDRLVYIEPNLNSYYPCINHFEFSNKENLTDKEAEDYAEAFLSIFKEILGNLGDDELSLSMEVILKNTLPVIIKKPNSSIYDLIDFLEPPQGKEKKFSEKVESLIDFANQNIKNQMILHFLNNAFKENSNYNATKFAIYTRLNAIFGSTTMQKMMANKATIDLEKLIQERKLIVFNFAKGGNSDYKILGLFMIAMIKILSFRRKFDKKAIPCHFFLDEFQNYITPSLQEILEECRKYGLFLTLVQQQVGVRMSKELRDSILGNVGVIMTFPNGFDSLKEIARHTGETVENLQKHLSQGHCSVWQRAEAGKVQKPPVFVAMPRNTLKNSQSMHEDQWQAVLQGQIERYYYSSSNDRTQTKTTQSSHKIGEDLEYYDKHQ